MRIFVVQYDDGLSMESRSTMLSKSLPNSLYKVMS
jgi:hypothetical protein